MSPSTFVIWLCASTLLILLFSPCINCAKEKPDDKEPSEQKWKKKDIRDYTEADLERLLEQWEVGSVCESEICRLLELLLCTCHLASFYWLAFLGPRELGKAFGVDRPITELGLHNWACPQFIMAEMAVV